MSVLLSFSTSPSRFPALHSSIAVEVRSQYRFVASQKGFSRNLGGQVNEKKLKTHEKTGWGALLMCHQPIITLLVILTSETSARRETSSVERNFMAPHFLLISVFFNNFFFLLFVNCASSTFCLCVGRNVDKEKSLCRSVLSAQIYGASLPRRYVHVRWKLIAEKAELRAVARRVGRKTHSLKIQTCSSPYLDHMVWWRRRRRPCVCVLVMVMLKAQKEFCSCIRRDRTRTIIPCSGIRCSHIELVSIDCLMMVCSARICAIKRLRLIN